MLNRELLRSYYFALENIRKLFPAMADQKWDKHEDTISVWYKELVALDCNDWELTQVMGRVLYHLFACDCTVIPTAEEQFKESVDKLDIVSEEHRQLLADSIAHEVKKGGYDWFSKFAGTRYLDTFAHLYQHLLAVRRGLPTTYCPFKVQKNVAH
jgi:hypothetical protein